MRGVLYSSRDRPRFTSRWWALDYWLCEVLVTGMCVLCVGGTLLVCILFVWKMAECILQGC